MNDYFALRLRYPLKLCLNFIFPKLMKKAEDAVCLADYCDIMRCEVLISHDSTLSFGDSIMMTTDIEIWSESTAYRTALMATGPRDLAKLPTRFVHPYSRQQNN